MSKVWTPDEIFNISNAYWQSCTLHTAVQLEIFTIVGEKKLSLSEIAERDSLNERSLKMLLDTLVAMELLVFDGKFYSNSQSVNELLNKESLKYIGYIAIHHHNVMEPWWSLEEAIRTGKPVAAKIPLEPEGQELWWKALTEGMLSLAIGYATYLAKQIDLSQYNTLLDLGGGPGTYAIQFCKHNPQLKATVIDVPVNTAIAERTIARFEAAEQVKYIGDDFYTMEMKECFDIIWISHVIHGENETDTQKLVDKAVKHLNPNGILMIHDYFMNDDGTGPLHPALFSLNMLLVTKEGKSYGISETMNILKRAGLKNVRHDQYGGELQSSIIMGTK
ncbi:acetylserotonin O-methyltransferase [Blautia pseudococcoides]|nr:acetylserotonin O-methyltransferase [Blautia pseudococcoides]